VANNNLLNKLSTSKVFVYELNLFHTYGCTSAQCNTYLKQTGLNFCSLFSNLPFSRSTTSSMQQILLL